MYDRILVPTDGSAGMREVIEHAGALAETHDARVRGLYVVDAASFTSLPMETTWEGVADILREEGEEALEEVERFAGDVPVECEVVEGTPSREIVSHATANDCDLVVMGTHGRGGIDRLLLGSVAERVVRSCDVPVLTVRVDAAIEEEPETSAPGQPDEERRKEEATPEPGGQ